MKIYDVIIIGGGGAGLAAALYTAPAPLATLIFEKLVPGGQIALTDIVENYPGFPEGVSGPDISQRLEEQAKKYGAQVIYGEAGSPQRTGEGFEVPGDGQVYRARALILASGASFRRLNVPGENEFTGRGVSYCATCDGAFFKNKEIMVVGGGDSAIQEGLFLTRFASKVTVIHRRDKLRASPILQKRARQNPKMAFVWDTVVEKISGTQKVEAADLKNLKNGEVRKLRTDGVFIFVGHEPNTAFLKGFVGLNDKGYVVTDPSLATSVPGVFSAGEARAGAVRQLVAACGEGCAAALAVQEYLDR